MISGGIATLAAAVIAALASLIGLILAKEQKVSDFRQSWVDSLRKEVGQFLADFTQVRDQVGRDFPTTSAKIEALSPLYSSLNRAANLIRLRLNPEEGSSIRVLEAIDSMEELAGDDSRLSSSEGDTLEKNFLEASQSLMKEEWDRVKKGEPTFRRARLGAAILAALSFIALVAVLLLGFGQNPKSEVPVRNQTINYEYQSQPRDGGVPRCAEPFKPIKDPNVRSDTKAGG